MRASQDVLPASVLLLELIDLLLLTAPIGHDADIGDSDPAAAPIDYLDERRDIDLVTKPQLTTDRSPLTVEYGTEDYLLEIRPLVLVVVTLNDRLFFLSLEVDGGRIEEDQLEVSEQITLSGEECLSMRSLLQRGANGVLSACSLRGKSSPI